MAKPKSKKTSTTSKKNKGGRPAKGHKFIVLDKTFKRSYPGQDPKIDLIPPKKQDIEKVAPEPDDEASKIKYPPPKKHPTFRKTWMQFIDNLTARENFKIGHLTNFEILCDLYVEYEELHEFIRENGRSYVSVGRSGEMWKLYPEVIQLNSVKNQIKDYTKMLGLVLNKDHSSESGGEKSEWD